MKSVLVVGDGAREHALAWKLRRSPQVGSLFIAPGNAGTPLVGENVPITALDVQGLVRFVKERSIDFTVVGPEAPLSLGLADALRAEGKVVFGPGAGAARIESSKSFAKDLMRKIGLPTASHRVFDDLPEAQRYLANAEFPLVIKADGLAAGKGVVVCRDAAEGRQTLAAFMSGRRHGAAGRRLVIEEMLVGVEVSLMALTDGQRCVPLPLSQDHKRLKDCDEGPNTGGMGAYAPAPFLTEIEIDGLVARYMEPVVQFLGSMGCPYRGVLYAGLMLTEDGPKVLEFNCRLGDPEAQALLPLIEDDLYEVFHAAASGSLDFPIRVGSGSAAAVVLASAGYPEHPVVGFPILGLDAPQSEETLLFHGGTRRDESERIVTSGGRVLSVVGRGRDLEEALRNAYSSPVNFAGMQMRSDIGRAAPAMTEAVLA